MHKPTIYVCSGLEYADKLDWREWFKGELESYYNVILPDIVPCPHRKEDPNYARWYHDNYIQKDLKDITQCDELFAYIDESFVNGAGGKSEVTFAMVWQKPITYCSMLPKITDIPAWTIGCLVDAKRVFSLEEAVAYYKQKNDSDFAVLKTNDAKETATI